jgi:hypothetical protein
MKRVGILTFHCAHNYGAVLQCYALQKFLESSGCEVEIIDHQIPSLLDVYKPICWRFIYRKNPIKLLKNVFHAIRYYLVNRARYNSFNKFSNQYLNCQPVETIHTNPYDVIIVGSDQVWNPQLTNGYDPFYWGSFGRPKGTKLISYAASMYDIWSEDQDERVCELLQNFDAISVREEKVQKKIMQVIPGREIRKVVDPIFLLSDEQWTNVASIPSEKKAYLLLFQVERVKKSEEIAKRIATDLNLSIIYLSAKADRINTPSVVASSPADFVGLFKHASFVVCTSFHGTAFSILLHKQFVSVKTNTPKDARVEGLLDSLGLSKRFISDYEDYDKREKVIFDDSSISKLALFSKQYLSDNIYGNY